MYALQSQKKQFFWAINFSLRTEWGCGEIALSIIKQKSKGLKNISFLKTFRGGA